MLPQVEIRQGGRLRGLMLTEGRAASGGRREVFAPGSVEWPEAGVGILTEHRAAPVMRAVPRREDLGRIVLEAPATPEVRQAVEDGKRYMSVEFFSREERTTAGGVREILRAMVPDVALVAEPEFDTTSAEIRQEDGGSLVLVEGPAGSGKSQLVATMLQEGEADIQADLTAMWVALRGVRRGPDGRYPIRTDADPAISTGLAAYMRRTAVRQGVRSGLRVVVTSGSPGAALDLQAIADALGVTFEVRTVDPGEATVRARLAGADGELGEECERAVRRWYGGRARRSVRRRVWL